MVLQCGPLDSRFEGIMLGFEVNRMYFTVKTNMKAEFKREDTEGCSQGALCS